MAKVRAGSDRCLLFYRQGLGLRGQRQDPGRGEETLGRLGAELR